MDKIHARKVEFLVEEPYIQVYRTTKGEESTQEQMGVQTKERQREVVKVKDS